MAAKGAASGSLNAKNLEALGAARLAELLMTLCEGNNASKRLLRLALAEQKGPLEMARELRKRLASIARSGSLLDDHQRDELLRELRTDRGSRRRSGGGFAVGGAGAVGRADRAL
jgi:hypothetical protein